MKKLLLTLLLFTFSINSFSLIGGSSYDGVWMLNVSETISYNKGKDTEIPQKRYVELIKYSKVQKFIFDGDIVTMEENNKIEDGCLLNKQKTSMECKEDTIYVSKVGNRLQLRNHKIPVFVLEKK